jgi:hypothetical protein
MATLTATWATVKATTILDPELGMRYHLDDISSKEGSIEVSDDGICGSYYILKAPDGLDREKGWRINYVISGGGGRGGPATIIGTGRHGAKLRLGGGGGSGQYKTGMANLGSDITHIAVYVGRGGGSEGASSDGNGESTRIYAIAGYTSSTENVVKVSSISNLSHRTLAIALGGNVGGAIEGGHANDENNTLIQGMAKGGKASESYDSDGEEGAKNGQLSGGLGGKSSRSIAGERQGGGGGGAGGVSFSWLLPKYEDDGEESDKLRVYSVESTGGKGAGYQSDATKGTYGGGAGGNGSPGGNGFAVIHFC